MAFKVVSSIILMVTVGAEVNLPSYYQGSLTYAAGRAAQIVHDDYSVLRFDGGLSPVDSVNRYNAVIGRQSHPVVYDPLSYTEGGGSSWNYFIPVTNSENFVPASYPELKKVVPLAAPWTCDAPHAYSTSATPSSGPDQQLPFGYVAPVAKISVPPGYKIH